MNISRETERRRTQRLGDGLGCNAANAFRCEKPKLPLFSSSSSQSPLFFTLSLKLGIYPFSQIRNLYSNIFSLSTNISMKRNLKGEQEIRLYPLKWHTGNSW